MPRPTTFTDTKWKPIFQRANFTDFESWWKAEGDLVEKGSFWGRDKSKSWSCVTRLHLDDGITLYLKRQQNQRPGNAIKKILGYLTFEVEWENYQRLKSLNIPSVRYIHFDKRTQDGNRQCLLVSEDLQGMIPLKELIKHYKSHGWPPREVRYAILLAILDPIRKLHDAGMIHNALRTKHVFINIPITEKNAEIPEKIKTCFIDLERAKHVGTKSSKLIYKDLATLAHRTKSWPRRDLLWFFKQYINATKLTNTQKVTVKRLIKKARI